MKLFNLIHFFISLLYNKSVIIGRSYLDSLGESQAPTMSLMPQARSLVPKRTVRPVLIQDRHHSARGMQKGERSLDLVSKDGPRGVSEESHIQNRGESGKAELDLKWYVW